MALVEAMLFGVPLVSMFFDGLEDIVSDGINGLIVPTLGGKKVLAGAIRSLIVDKVKRKNMSDFCINMSKNYIKNDLVFRKWKYILDS